MRSRSLVAMIALWLVVVAASAALVSFVIDRAGRSLIETGNVSFAGSKRSLPLASTPPGRPSASPTRKPRRPASPATTASPSPGAIPASNAPVSPQPTARSTPRPTRSPASGQPSSTTDVRTWSGTGGSVTVACTGSTIDLRGATPDDGWRLERGSQGPQEVEVTFLRSASRVQVLSHCSGGKPVFEVDRETGD